MPPELEIDIGCETEIKMYMDDSNLRIKQALKLNPALLGALTEIEANAESTRVAKPANLDPASILY